jgi:hypothetical protein
MADDNYLYILIGIKAKNKEDEGDKAGNNKKLYITHQV